jgi:hypothetical protein
MKSISAYVSWSEAYENNVRRFIQPGKLKRELKGTYEVSMLMLITLKPLINTLKA